MFPIWIHINLWMWTVKNNFDANPFNLDQKAVRNVVFIQDLSRGKSPVLK